MVIYKPIQFDAALHERGEREEVRSETVLELAWDVAASLVARHPGRLRVVEAHPISIYDCVAVLDLKPRPGPASFLAYLNLAGHVTTQFEGRMASDDRFNWSEILHTTDRTNYVIKQIEGATGLRRPSITPRIRTTSIGPLVLAQIAAISAGGPARFTIRAGFGFDSDDAPFRSELFDHFSQISPWEFRSDDIPEASRFWFVLAQNGDPVVAIDTGSGVAYTPRGRQASLLTVYRSEENDISRAAESALYL